MFESGQRVRIRDHTLMVLEDRSSVSGDHALKVRGVEHDVQGLERVFVYRPNADDPEIAGPDLVEALPAPELRWEPGTPPSRWERLHTAYRLSLSHGSDTLLSLARARLVIEPYQLEPVIRIMAAPRQRFLLAEDVGMGKTIEAGLVLLELIARGRGDRVLVMAPAGLQDQWSDELRDKLGLEFTLVDSDALANDIIPRLPSGANPWRYLARVITSIDFAKQDRVLRALKQTRWDIIIVDEAHYLAESGTDTQPVRTDRSRLGAALAPLCDNLLLLTGTPHNGFAHGFLSLLHLLDDTRFATEASLRPATVNQVMIRRSKQTIFRPDGSRKFQPRTIQHLELDLFAPEQKAERRFYEAVSRYVTRNWKAARKNAASRATVGFAMTLLKKRLISSLGAIRASLRARLEGLSDESVAPDARRGLLASYRAGVPLTERQRERVEGQMVVLAGESGAEAMVRERRDLERLLKMAEDILPEADHKAKLLRETLDAFCLRDGRKVIVFTEYLATLEYLREYLEARGYAGRIAVMHGHKGRQERLAAEQQFHQPETCIHPT